MSPISSDVPGGRVSDVPTVIREESYIKHSTGQGTSPVESPARSVAIELSYPQVTHT